MNEGDNNKFSVCVLVYGANIELQLRNFLFYFTRNFSVHLSHFVSLCALPRNGCKLFDL